MDNTSYPPTALAW